jgi:LPPG:FO 2-phospho-L-lactate transferase
VTVVVLAGGTGGAKLAAGIQDLVGSELAVVANTADDVDVHGLRVCPDPDLVTYWLADEIDEERGWGIRGDSFTVSEQLKRLGAPGWFALSDRDLATCLYRTHFLAEGGTLTAAQGQIARELGLAARVLPMSEERVSTRVRTPAGWRGLQEFLILDGGETPIEAVEVEGIGDAQPTDDVRDALAKARTIVIGPSNPVISIGPILAVPGLRDTLAARRERVVGVSPIVAGAPVRGPADRLMAPLGIEVSCVGVARAYADICATLVIDSGDAARAAEVEAAGVRAVVADTMMRDARIAAALARHTLAAVA